eukprot:11611169-Prorocentrum_lima.AAC.1
MRWKPSAEATRRPMVHQIRNLAVDVLVVLPHRQQVIAIEICDANQFGDLQLLQLGVEVLAVVRVE